ncbi:MAG: DUF4982 domain-containing protein [Lachnospiraceae bacterium]|nr:DUF4982 domain-containing protein [Lachnospiraceae bacterium]
MKEICIDEKWSFRQGFLDSLWAINEAPCEEVNLPHDAMIGTAVSPDAVAQQDSGYYKGGICNYTKYLFISQEWDKETIMLSFDGAMMNATVEVNGYKVALQHYGYAPFCADITGLVAYGRENRVTVHVDTSSQPNSRWYTGTGLYRSVKLLHGPKVHIVPDGIYVFTKEVSDNRAFLEARVEIVNDLAENRLVRAEVIFIKETDYETGKTDAYAAKASQTVQINPHSVETAKIAMIIEDPIIWDQDSPNLYRVVVRVTDTGAFRTHFIKDRDQSVDESSVLFGIRTITADPVRGLRINGKTVKLKGGCLHHDNGLLGAISLYETEVRKIKKLKEVGFNAIRTAHNPPSAALVEACDRVGMYIFDEAFDAWGIAKRSGDYSRYFDTDWEKDLTAFIKRDRTHPSVIMWSTGNEIPERGGLNNGYSLATMLANRIRDLDATRPISNGICSFWSGMDDERAEGKSPEQNAPDEPQDLIWEKWTEAFTNGLDVVGYNYMEDLYERDHELFPQRVILGSENFPKDIGFRWPMIERLPYVIGEFTWTAWDYLGEAGVGRALYLEEGDPLIEKGPWAVMPHLMTVYPWRTANDADFDITGLMLPQGAYRSVVFGNSGTFLYSYHPDSFGKYELMSMWGFPAIYSSWNYEGYEGKPVELMVFSDAEEVEFVLNGRTLGRKKVSNERPMPRSVRFEAVYEPGKIEAISFRGGREVSRACLETTGRAAGVRLLPEKTVLSGDGHDVTYVIAEIIDEKGAVVPEAEVKLHAALEGDAAKLSGFGTGNPVTEEVYTDNDAVSYRGRATAVIRAGYGEGKAVLTVEAELPGGLVKASCQISQVIK